MTRVLEVLEVAPARAAGVGHGRHPDAQREAVGVEAVVARVRALLARAREDVNVDVDEARASRRGRETSTTLNASAGSIFAAHGGDLPARDGHVAHGAEAVLGVDDVPAAQQQVVLRLRRRSTERGEEPDRARRERAGRSSSLQPLRAVRRRADHWPLRYSPMSRVPAISSPVTLPVKV